MVAYPFQNFRNISPGSIGGLKMYLLEGLHRMVCAKLLLVYKPEIQGTVRQPNLIWGRQRGTQLFGESRLEGVRLQRAPGYKRNFLSMALMLKSLNFTTINFSFFRFIYYFLYIVNLIISGAIFISPTVESVLNDNCIEQNCIQEYM